MQDVPNIARERLKAAAPDSTHPDANVLTAFAEKSLPERERRGVIEHLARCGDCRDIVALALPAADSTQAVVRPSPARWLSRPVLRWGVVAAGVVLVASFLTLQNRRSETVARFVAPGEAHDKLAALETKRQQQPTAPAPEAKPEEQKTASAAARARAIHGANAAPASPAPPERRIITPSLAFHGHAVGGIGSEASRTIGGPVMQKQWQQQAYQMQPPPPAAPAAKRPTGDVAWNATPPKASTTVEVSGEAPLVQAQTETSAADQAAQLASVEAMSKAKPAMTSAAPAMKLAAAATPQWTISATGGLQRSFDQGQTWQDVDVMTNTLPSESVGLNFASKAVSSAENVKAVPMAAKRQAVAPTFRAVTATGSEVWAGGAAGALYHSVDAGMHWMRVTASYSGVVLTDDIVRLEFADAQHGSIVTSSGEVWTTSDDGQTWQKR